MEKFSLPKENGHAVSCAKEIPSQPACIVLVVHGFTSSKESATVQRLMRLWPAAGVGVVAIDLPAHGVEESKQEELRLEACKDSMAAAEAWIVGHYPNTPIGYFGSSFGAYVTCLYISTREHKGQKAFFRSAAVNMPSLFLPKHPTEAQKKLMEELEEKGVFQATFDLGNPVTVTRAMIEDLRNTDLFQCFDLQHGARHAIAMAHGTEDATIDPAEARRFAEKFQIPITFFEGEGHSLDLLPGTAEKVAGMAADLFLDTDF